MKGLTHKSRQCNGDIVKHDRCHNNVYIDVSLQNGRDQRVKHSRQSAAKQRHGDLQCRRYFIHTVISAGDQRRGICADIKLSLHTDIPHARLKRKCRRHTGHNDGTGKSQRIHPAAETAKTALYDQPVYFKGIVSDDQAENSPHGKGA